MGVILYKMTFSYTQLVLYFIEVLVIFSITSEQISGSGFPNNVDEQIWNKKVIIKVGQNFNFLPQLFQC